MVKDRDVHLSLAFPALLEEAGRIPEYPFVNGAIKARQVGLFGAGGGGAREEKGGEGLWGGPIVSCSLCKGNRKDNLPRAFKALIRIFLL